MDHYVTGAVIRSLREKQGMTQAQLAERLCVTDKAVSKWETGKGFPDLTLLEPLAAALRVSVPELLSGRVIVNGNRASNLLRSRLCRLGILVSYYDITECSLISQCIRAGYKVLETLFGYSATRYSLVTLLDT